MRSLLTLFVLCWGMLCQAQVWQADWQAEGHPDAARWRYDREAFLQHGGRLRLSVADSLTAGRVTLVTSLELPARPCWRGTIHLGIRPTRPNHPQILLCATEALSSESYEYLALDFGGAVAGRVSLVRVLVTRGAVRPQVKLRAISPLLVGQQELGEGMELTFLLAYSAEEGWRLYLQEQGRDEGLHLAGQQTDYRPLLTPKNSLGISCAFTAKGRHAWSFRDLSVAPFAEELLQPPTPDPGTPVPPADLATSPHLLLSEVMARPQGKAPEYVELYNPTEHPCSLADYLLYVGSDEEHLHTCTLPAVLVEAHSYVLLTREERALRTAYPQLPATAQVVAVKLPRLTNRAGLVALVTETGEVLDRMDYSPDLFPPKLRRQAGVALERRDLLQPEGQGTWRPASAASGYATPGLPPSGDAEPPDAASLETLLKQLARGEMGDCRWELFSLLGERLALGEGMAGKDLLLRLAQDPGAFFALVPQGASGRPLLLRLSWFSASGELKRQSFLLGYHTR